MQCVCGSESLTLVRTARDDQVSGGQVRIYECNECGEVVEDVPPEVVDEQRDRSAG